MQPEAPNVKEITESKRANIIDFFTKILPNLAVRTSYLRFMTINNRTATYLSFRA